ncbi:MAG: translation initiation factor IF-2 [Clostridiaceae bacterium]|nr:translation initiation factor IF-2 [Clostridiaceae bacterium]
MTEKKDLTDRKNDKTEPVTHSDMEITGPEIIVSGISGTKTLRVGRVNKKSRATPQDKAEGVEAKEQSSVKSVEPVKESIPKPSEEKVVGKTIDKPESQVSASAQVTPKEALPPKESTVEVAVPVKGIAPDSVQEKPAEVSPISTPMTENRNAAPSNRANTVRTDRSSYVPGSDNRPRQGYTDRGPSFSGQQGNGPRPSGNNFGQGGPRPGGNSYGQGGPRPGGNSYGQGGPRPGGNSYGQGGPRPGGGNFGPGGPRPGGNSFGQGGPRPGGASFAPGGQRGPGQRPDSDRPGQGRPSFSRPAPKDEDDTITLEKSKEKANFAARDAIDKSRKEVNKDFKKDAVRPTGTQGDKRVGNQRAVTSAFVGRDATDILADDTVLDASYPVSHKGRRSGQRRRGNNGQAQEQPKAVLTHVQLPEIITVKDFSEGIQKRSSEVIKKLMKLGMLATLNQEIDFDTATLIAEEFGITTEKLLVITEEDILFDDTEDTDENLRPRPPVVVVMGHVDHGKTSLLDRIRSATVVKGEAGGITQHIGAYTVRLNEKRITFLDTPGHEAFTTMRARGAQVTDIAILVVAADDGVMPQTIEAINHARAANTEIVVAINKIDRPGANVDKVKQELSVHGILPEDWGGSTIMVPVSAHTGEGIEELLEMVLLTAEVMDLKADPDKQAKGTVIEARLDKNRGPVATVLVQRGTLRSGDTVVTGSTVGRVRAMTDDKGAEVKKAGPSVPVEILGLSEVPEAGEIFYAVTDEKVARQLAEKRRVKQREDQLRKSSRMSLETLAQTLAAGEIHDLNLIVKADVQGSVEAVIQSLEKLTNDEVRVRVVHGAVGAITEADVTLADVTNAIIIGFNVRPSAMIVEMAKEAGVDIKLYRVIYNAIEDIEAAMKGLLKPKFEEAILGHIEIRQIFKVSSVGTIGGAYVLDGKVLRSSEVRIVRSGIVVHEGKLASLKRFKDDVKEVNAGYECGISIEGYNDIIEGDVIEAFEMREKKR